MDRGASLLVMRRDALFCGHRIESAIVEVVRMSREPVADQLSDEYFRNIYTELHTLAERQMRQQRKDHTLQASALVNEAWLRLKDVGDNGVNDREHFLAIAATAMRQVLVDHARKKQAVKRGMGGNPISLHDAGMVDGRGSTDFLGFDDALRRLEVAEPRKAKVVSLRVYAGMTIDEVAAVIGVSHMTVSTDWKIATAWLSRELDRK